MATGLAHGLWFMVHTRRLGAFGSFAQDTTSQGAFSWHRLIRDRRYRCLIESSGSCHEQLLPLIYLRASTNISISTNLVELGLPDHREDTCSFDFNLHMLCCLASTVQLPPRLTSIADFNRRLHPPSGFTWSRLHLQNRPPAQCDTLRSIGADTCQLNHTTSPASGPNYNNARSVNGSAVRAGQPMHRSGLRR